MPAADAPAIRVAIGDDGGIPVALTIGPDGSPPRRDAVGDLASFVAGTEARLSPRWVFADATATSAALLAAGVRIGRAHDLRLCHAILRDAVSVRDDHGLRRRREWDAAPAPTPDETALFDLGDSAPALPRRLDDVVAELGRQDRAVTSAADPGRLRLLLAAESTGALIAAELRAAGLPWDRRRHDEILTAELGARPAAGAAPQRLAAVGDEVRGALGDPRASLDSQPKLLRALHRAGVPAESTSRWELARYDHPAVPPLLEYKRLARLLTANGWSWLDEWVKDERFRPVYVPGGVVTGRWASSGGGALQVPRQLRPAVRADPGWRLVTADVAQLEPRVLAGMARDLRLAEAARGRDLYAGVVATAGVSDRAEAKIALLGAMYGATSGDAGRLMPRLRRAFPDAMGLVDEAARTGEDGGVVSTWLGRTCPAPGDDWRSAQARASEADASESDRLRARRVARDRGRFTRNFVVQGTAAEWALVWLAELRRRLDRIAVPEAAASAPASGAVFARRPHLAFFLHDEVIVHTPAELADQVAIAARDAATAAAAALFGGFPIDFPLDVRIAETADKR